LGKPYASVLIDTYNHEKFIEQAIVSVRPLFCRKLFGCNRTFAGSHPGPERIVPSAAAGRPASANHSERERAAATSGTNETLVCAPAVVSDRRCALALVGVCAGYAFCVRGESGIYGEKCVWLDPSPLSTNLGAGATSVRKKALRAVSHVSKWIGQSDRFALIAEKPATPRGAQA
jgi:hypothetical protein